MGIREYGYRIGEGETGTENLITDVPGVSVGQVTIDNERNKTGITVIIPCEGFIFGKKPVAACYALNGFGKTMGMMQIEELGVIETPIALTNTLNVGKVADGLVEYTLQECQNHKRALRSVNPVVGETNDGRINQITSRVIGTKEVLDAIQSAGRKFEQGAVGAGKGTVCMGLKGGIGSSSRILHFGNQQFTIGILVQSNFGRIDDFVLNGENIGIKIQEKIQIREDADKGSVMVVLATDIPLSARQLKRVLRRATVGLIRVGSRMGHGSGDVFLGFTNANYMQDAECQEIGVIHVFPENMLDMVFRLVGEATEEAVLNSMIYADETVGVDGMVFHSLREFI